jgi:Tfp pilus assembly protein PilN
MLVAVNLLPADRRAKSATPLGVFLPLLGGVVVVALGTVFWAWLRFSELSRAEDDLSDLEANVASKQPALKYLAALKDEQADFETRTKTIKEIAASRVLWTKKLDEFFDVAVDDDDGRRYLMWLEQLEVKAAAQQSGKKEAKGDQLSVKGRCLADGDALQRFNVFHAALKESAFFKPDFEEINDPAGASEELKDGRKPSTAWSVDLAMSMKPREPDKKPVLRTPPGRQAQQGR